MPELLEVTLSSNIVIGNSFLVLVVDEYHFHGGEKEQDLFHSPYLREKNTLRNPKYTMGVWVNDAVFEEFLQIEYTRIGKERERENK